MRHECFASSLISPSLGASCWFGSALTAVVIKTRSPQITGLEWARPGIGVFHRMLTAFSASQSVGKAAPSVTPEAFGPRNEGQFCARAVAERHPDKISASINLIIFDNAPSITILLSITIP